MHQIQFADSVYRSAPKSVSLLARWFPGLTFYRKFLGVVLSGSKLAKRGNYDNTEWCRSSITLLRAMEYVGFSFEIDGIQYVEKIEGPCVFIANHMSTLETVILPIVIQPVRDVTFIVKQDLLEVPFFRHIMRSRDPIAVGRSNPRQDLKAVLEGGVERLKRGISIIVFPQTTRMPSIDPTQFNTIGIKLAKKADVPIIPLALLTDAWGTGTFIKDFGKINPAKPVHFSFGEPMRVLGRGTDEHESIIRFIEGKLKQWRNEEFTI